MNEAIANRKAELLWQIMQHARMHFNSWNYRSFLLSDFVISTLMMEFKAGYVFTKREYQKDFALYQKGRISWEHLKEVSNTIFRKEVKSCNDEEIIRFFGI